MFIIHLPTRKRNRQERSLTILRYGNVENSRSADGKQTFTARWKSRRLSHSPQTSFPTARKHRFPQLRKHDRLRTFPQRLLRRISFLSCPILIEREKREQKKKRERHPRPKPKAALPLCYGKAFKTASLHPSNQREKPAWEIIRAAPGKAATDDFSAHFQPLSAHFFERADW